MSRFLLLTPRQTAVLAVILDDARRGAVGTLAEIGARLTPRVTGGAVQGHVSALVRKGLVSRTKRKARGIRVATLDRQRRLPIKE